MVQKRKFIDKITQFMSRKNVMRRRFVGDYIYIPLKSGINIKLYCVSKAVVCEVISRTCGKIDYIELSFMEYFMSRKYPLGTGTMYPTIDGENWSLSEHKYTIPTDEEFEWLAGGIEEVIALYDVPEEDA